MRSSRTITVAALAATLVLVTSACGGGDGDGGGGTITADGSSTVGPFRPRPPRTSRPRVASTSPSASRDGRRLRALLPGRDGHLERVAGDHGRRGRGLRRHRDRVPRAHGRDRRADERRERRERLGRLPDGRPAEGDLEARLKVENWSQLDPSFPDEPLRLYGAGTDSGTFDYFTDAIIGEEGQRTDYYASEDDNVTPSGGLRRARGPRVLRLLVLRGEPGPAEGSRGRRRLGCVAPGVATAQDGTYAPLSRPLFVYVEQSSTDEDEDVRDFVRFMLDNEQSIAEEAQFVPLADAQLAEQRSKFEERVELGVLTGRDSRAGRRGRAAEEEFAGASSSSRGSCSSRPPCRC